ncbi:MAG: hypothetical protein ACE5Q3_05410 [Alphaproteobacteria bacterium]
MIDTRLSALKRILLALDASERGASAIDIATLLAAGLEAELEGVFVEDAELIKAAGLPFTRLVHSQAGAVGPLDARLMRRALAARAERAQRDLAAAAGRRGVTWSFRITSRQVAEEVTGQPERRDLITVAGSAVAARLPEDCSALWLNEKCRVPGAVLLLFDGGERTFATAAELARIFGCPLKLLISSVPLTGDLQRRVSDWLAERGQSLVIERLDPASETAIQDAVRRETAPLLVLERSGEPGRALDVRTLLRETDCSVLGLC